MNVPQSRVLCPTGQRSSPSAGSTSSSCLADSQHHKKREFDPPAPKPRATTHMLTASDSPQTGTTRTDRYRHSSKSSVCESASQAKIQLPVPLEPDAFMNAIMRTEKTNNSIPTHGANGNWQCRFCVNTNWAHRKRCNRCDRLK